MHPGHGRRPKVFWFFFSKKNILTLIRSASLRFAALFGIVFALSAMAFVGFLWYSTAGLLDRQVEAAISADAQGLVERWSEGGIPALLFTIQERMNENVDDDAIYEVIDPLGSTVGGNMGRWPQAVTSPGVFYELMVVRADTRSLAEVRRYDLPGGFHLLVGRDVRGRVELRRLLTNALFSSMLVITGLGAIGAFVIRNLFRRMVAEISATADAIAGGDLSPRVRRTGRGDEFDRMAESINTMLERIARLMDGVRQVSNAIAHDLRTPITRARARLEDAATHARSETELRAAVERAVSDLDGVTSVFQALMRIAEIEVGARRSAFADVDLGPLLADLTELYGAAAEERGLVLTLSVPDTLTILGDRDMLQQALANLLDNAIKFSAPGGRIRLEAALSDRHVRVSVTDSGPGIPQADIARATERFFRGEQARHTPGSGLGLALVQAVAALHEGSLLLSDAEPGLRATITLPAMPPGSGGGHMKIPSSAPHGVESGAMAHAAHR
jgi:signal transduction histidine kinase